MKWAIRLGQSGALFSWCMAGIGGGVLRVSCGKLGIGGLASPGPGFFPGLLGVVLLVVGIAGGLTAVRSFDISRSVVPRLGRSGHVRLWGTLGLYIAWLLAMPVLGYVLTTLVVCLALSKIQGLEGWGRPFLLSLAVTAFIYVVFDLGFFIDLPRGIIG